MTLSDAMTRKASNLDLLRLIAALAVIVSHAWPLALGPGAAEPLEALTGRSLGGWAVTLFFFLSGFLIVQSAERRSALAFWTARARRILPGLTVALLATLVLAVSFGGTPDATEAARYVLRGLSLFGLEHQITGAFAANPYPHAVNGALWSLQYEVAAYAICFAAVRVGLMRGMGLEAFVAVALGMAFCTALLPLRAAAFAPLFLAFTLGMAAWRMRALLPMAPWLLILPVAAAILAKGSPLGDIAATVAFAHAALLVAFRLPALTLAEDISFGLYIYGWPVGQSLVALLPGIAPVELALLTILSTLPFAMASLALVERPAMAARARLA